MEKVKTYINILENKPFIMAGPCSVESEEQVMKIAGQLAGMGIKILRGGAFKPRTSPKSFQGLGEEGLDYLRKAADKFNMLTVSEVLESAQLEKSYDNIDIIQIGSRNMASYGFLKYVAKMTAGDKKPILLKRGFSSTLNELLYAADYLMEHGNTNIMLCLRGIRTFEQSDSSLRFTPDLGSILELKEKTGLPVLFDPSHSTGYSRYVIPISKAALSLGADGLLIETHYDPNSALSDGIQSIHPAELQKLIDYINLSKSNEGTETKI